MIPEATNNPTHLTKIKIRGLWGRYDLGWELNRDVNVLAGGNGSGKSTIIKHLYSLLNMEYPPINKASLIKNILLTFNDKEFLAVEYQPPLESIKKKAKNGDEYCQHIINTLKNHVGNDYNNITKLKGLIHSSYENNDRDINKLINIDYISTFDTELKPQELLKKVDDNTKTELDFQLWNLQKKYLNYQINIGKKLRVNKGNIDDNSTYSHDKFIEIIDSLFAETDKKINQDENELSFLLGGKEINVYQLSSGEKQLLVIFLTVLIQDNKPSILFMDEPEISLHIEWQRKLIKYIRELNPNVQLIIATHSPDIIMDGWLDKIFNIQDLVITDNHI